MQTKHNRISFFAMNHLRAFFFSLGELIRHPIASLMTLAVIGVTMALPAGLYLLLQNFQHMSNHWDGTPTLSVYLKTNITSAQTHKILTVIKSHQGVKTVTYVSPQQGLTEFKQIASLGDALKHLQHNPLPGVAVVTPTNNNPDELHALSQQLQLISNVSSIQLDLAWVKRLYYIITLMERIVYTLAILFSIGVILITSNTIRLTTQNNQREILILRLIGATPAFIRRPLLYRGLLYGLIGGIIAWLLVSLMLWWLSHPAYELAMSYGSQTEISGLGFKTGSYIIVFGAVLGLIGSYFAVNKHLTSEENL